MVILNFIIYPFSSARNAKISLTYRAWAAFDRAVTHRASRAGRQYSPPIRLFKFQSPRRIAPVQDGIGWQFPKQWRTGTVWTLQRQTAHAWLNDRAPSMSAALAQCNLFLLAPPLPTVICVAGLIFDGWYVVGAAANAIGGFLLVAAMFALICRVLPRAHVQWNDVWTGALFTAILFTLDRFVIGRFGVSSGFGAARSLVIVLLWVYYSAQVFLFGAEFTWVYSHACGSRKPAVRT